MRRWRAPVRGIRLLHLRELRLHPLRTGISIVSVAAGVAMILSVVVVVRSTTTSFERQSAALAGPAPLRVTGVTSMGGLDATRVEEVRATEGVAAAIPMIRSVVTVEHDHRDALVFGDDVLVLGIDCQTASFLGTDCATVTDVPLVSTSLANDARTGWSLRTDGGRVALDPARVAPELDGLGERVAVVTIPAAQTMFGRGQGLDVIYVVPSEGVPVADLEGRLRAALGPGPTVLTVAEPPFEFEQVLNTIIPLFGILGLFALAIGMILVANTVALSLEERRQQLAIVAALGGTNATVVGGALLQAAVIGLLGGILGIGGAIALAYPLTASVSGFTLPIAGIEVQALPSEAPVPLALLMGAGVAVVAAWRPARRALRSDVAAELSNRDRRAEADTSLLAARAVIAIALGMAGAGVAGAAGANGSLEGWQPRLAPVGLLVTILGLSIGTARLTPVVAQLVLRRLRPRSGSVRLAVANLVREPARTGVMALAVGSAVGVAFMVASFNQSASAGISDGVSRNLAGKLAISIGSETQDQDLFTRIPPATVEAISSHPGVAATTRSAFLFVSNGIGMGIEGTEEAPAGLRVYRGTADPVRFAKGEVLIGAAVARRQHIEPGGHVRIPVRDGFASLPVQGIWADGNVVGNIVQMPLSTLEELFGPQPVDNLLLTPAEGVSVADLAASIKAAGYDPALRAEPGEAVAARIAANASTQLAPFWALQRGLTVVAFIAVLSTLLLIGVQRTRELALLAAVGMEPRSIGRMVVLEAVVVGVLGSVVGAVLAVGMFLAFYALTPLLIGWENPMRFALWSVPVYGVITVVLVGLGALLPAWRASRVNVVEALAYE
ncbi:MAG: ABC transporter permease [Microthrixaceae bacterium]